MVFGTGEASRFKDLFESWTPGSLNLGRWGSLVITARELKVRPGAFQQRFGCTAAFSLMSVFRQI